VVCLRVIHLSAKLGDAMKGTHATDGRGIERGNATTSEAANEDALVREVWN
jgi:hypothetical protein